MASNDHTPIVKNIAWATEADTRAFAAALATRLQRSNAGNLLIQLHGDLGAGKTTFVRHLLQALGVTGRIKSPTYAVVEPYAVDESSGKALDIWHFDFYRFSNPREWEDAGFRDIFASPGLKLAEWPGKAAGHVPVADLSLTIGTMTDESRQVVLMAGTSKGAAMLRELGA